MEYPLKAQIQPTIVPLILWVGVLSSLGCPTPSSKPTASSPISRQQFILHEITIDERRAGKALWFGTGATATGNFNKSNIANLRLTRYTQTQTETEFTLTSPIAELTLDKGIAKFKNPTITTADGKYLKASTTDYNENRKLIIAQGPIIFKVQGFQVLGTKAKLNLEKSKITITGPIQGKFMPSSPLK